MGFLMGRLVGPIATALAVLFLVGFVWQTVRIDGVLGIGGLREEIAECRSINDAANDAALRSINLAREEGRVSAEAAAAFLLQEEAKRRGAADETIAGLRLTVARLRRPPVPQPVILPGEPPPSPPPLPTACVLDQGALDDIRGALNAQRGSR